MKVHEIKLENRFCEDVVFGRKSFELRKNDRDYKVGDLVKFITVDEASNPSDCMVREMIFAITFIIDGYGLKDGYVAFAIEHVKIVKVGAEQ